MNDDARMEKRLEIAANVVLIAGHLMMYASLFFLFEHYLDFFFTLLGPLACIPALIFAAAPTYIGSYANRSLKEKRNRLRMKRIRDHAKTDDRPPFLVLRSFEEGPLTSQPARRPIRGVATYGASYAHDIASALMPRGRLIALGGPADVRNYYEASDVLYIQSREQDWLEMFSAALSAAQAVILVPGLSDGLLREIRAIAALHSWDKVLVFMPPVPDPNRPFKFTSFYVNEKAAGEEWEKVRARWNELGYELPEYVPAGMVYLSGVGFSAGKSVSLEHDVRNLDAALNRLLADQEGSGAALKDLLPLLEQSEAPPRRPGLFSRIYEPG